MQVFGPSVRRAAYLYERMFPRLEQRLRAQLDLIVEFSTLGEYRVATDGAVVHASDCDPSHTTGESGRARGDCRDRPHAAGRTRGGMPETPYGVCSDAR